MNSPLTVYKASAGSGKTFTLTVEYISLLLKGAAADGFRYILAVTFTNKATAEMKERILQTLYALGYGLVESQDYLVQIKERTGLCDAEIKQRSLATLCQILHNYDRFRVETIDSFFQSLLQNLAHELSLTANFSVDINDSEVTEAAVDQLMDEVEYNPRVLAWILAYIKERIDDNRRWNISKEVKSFARNLFIEKYVVNEDKMRESLSDDTAVNVFRQTLRDKTEQALDVIKSAAEEVEHQMQEHDLTYSSFSRGSALQTYLTKLRKGDFTPPALTVLGYMENPENWLRKADVKKYPEILSAITSYLQPALLATEQLRSSQELVYNSCLLTLQHLNPLRLLDVISRKIKELNEEANRFMLAKTPILLSRMVNGDDTSFVFEKVGLQLRHILIDEFQDTSVLQWKNFKNLLLESLASGHQCLLVGDVKQSIYRWRNGDWGILAGIKDEFPSLSINHRSLDTNYRSERVVIDFNNAFFASAAGLLDSLSDDISSPLASRTITNLYADVAQQMPPKKYELNKGYVSLRIYDKTRTPEWETEMLEELAQNVFSLHEKGLPYHKMVILLRKGKDITPIADYFSTYYPMIPLVSDEAFCLGSSSAVQMIIHALRYIVNPSDDIARAYLSLRYQSDVVGDTFNWNELGRENDKNTTLLPPELSTDPQRFASLPLYFLVEKLIRILSLTTLEGQDAYILSFLDETQRYLDDNPSDILKFLEYWEMKLSEKSIPSAKSEGLRMMTIHKSKGLQFHTVLLPYCHWKIERDRLDDLLWCSPNKEPYDLLPLVPISTTVRAERSIYATDYAQEHLQRRIENLNLLYVAFTRAEQNLMVWGMGKPVFTGSGMSVGDLINSVLVHLNPDCPYQYEIGNRCVEAKQKEQQVSENRLELCYEPQEVKFCSFESRVEFRQSNSSLDFVSPDSDEPNTTDYIHQGTLLHRVFSYIETSSDLESVLKQFEQQGLIGGRIKTDKLRKLIRQRLMDTTVAHWFDGSGRLFRECAILSHTPDGKLINRRPDRVIEYENEVVVVDFKFGKSKPEYRLQIVDYLTLLRAMGYTSVRGYLWYVYSGEVDAVL
ncbi:MAG: UvrD-helicase domain-containing protein [Bacteroidaceae bacterium]